MRYWEKRKLLLIIHYRAFLPEQAADPSHVEFNEEFRTQQQQHPGDACPSLSAAVVAPSVELLAEL
jgi:hypothetical protein